MKVAIVGPGIMPIPPTGWGAVEILIWDQKLALEKLGHEVLIINTQSPVEILQQINGFRPDFVHVQYDDMVLEQQRNLQNLNQMYSVYLKVLKILTEV